MIPHSPVRLVTSNPVTDSYIFWANSQREEEGTPMEAVGTTSKDLNA